MATNTAHTRCDSVNSHISGPKSTQVTPNRSQIQVPYNTAYCYLEQPQSPAQIQAQAPPQYLILPQTGRSHATPTPPTPRTVGMNSGPLPLTPEELEVQQRRRIMLYGNQYFARLNPRQQQQFRHLNSQQQFELVRQRFVRHQQVFLQQKAAAQRQQMAQQQQIEREQQLAVRTQRAKQIVQQRQMLLQKEQMIHQQQIPQQKQLSQSQQMPQLPQQQQVPQQARLDSNEVNRFAQNWLAGLSPQRLQHFLQLPRQEQRDSIIYFYEQKKDQYVRNLQQQRMGQQAQQQHVGQLQPQQHVGQLQQQRQVQQQVLQSQEVPQLQRPSQSPQHAPQSYRRLQPALQPKRSLPDENDEGRAPKVAKISTPVAKKQPKSRDASLPKRPRGRPRKTPEKKDTPAEQASTPGPASVSPAPSRSNAEAHEVVDLTEPEQIAPVSEVPPPTFYYASTSPALSQLNAEARVVEFTEPEQIAPPSEVPPLTFEYPSRPVPEVVTDNPALYVLYLDSYYNGVKMTDIEQGTAIYDSMVNYLSECKANNRTIFDRAVTTPAVPFFTDNTMDAEHAQALGLPTPFSIASVQEKVRDPNYDMLDPWSGNDNDVSSEAPRAETRGVTPAEEARLEFGIKNFLATGQETFEEPDMSEESAELYWQIQAGSLA